MSEAKEFDCITWAEAPPELPRCPGPLLDSWNSSAAKNAAKSVWSQRRPCEMALVNLDRQFGYRVPAVFCCGRAQAPGQFRLTVGKAAAANRLWPGPGPAIVAANLDTDNLDTEYLQCFVAAEPKRQGSSDAQWAEQQKPKDSGLGQCWKATFHTKWCLDTEPAMFCCGRAQAPGQLRLTVGRAAEANRLWPGPGPARAARTHGGHEQRKLHAPAEHNCIISKK